MSEGAGLTNLIFTVFIIIMHSSERGMIDWSLHYGSRQNRIVCIYLFLFVTLLNFLNFYFAVAGLTAINLAYVGFLFKGRQLLISSFSLMKLMQWIEALSHWPLGWVKLRLLVGSLWPPSLLGTSRFRIPQIHNICDLIIYNINSLTFIMLSSILCRECHFILIRRLGLRLGDIGIRLAD